MNEIEIKELRYNKDKQLLIIKTVEGVILVAQNVLHVTADIMWSEPVKKDSIQILDSNMKLLLGTYQIKSKDWFLSTVVK